MQMARDEGQRRAEAAMGDGDAGIGGRGDGGGHAGHDLEGHTRRDQRFGLLAAAAENEGIAALQADHDLPREAALDQQGVDLGLGDAGGPLPHQDVLGARVEGIRVSHPSCVSKTFPEYFARLQGLGLRVTGA